jgi:hypothetical protein
LEHTLNQKTNTKFGWLECLLPSTKFGAETCGESQVLEETHTKNSTFLEANPKE